MEADALYAPQPAVRPAPSVGELRLHLELRWRGTVLLARSFAREAWAGPSKWAPFPLEGFEVRPATLLGRRHGDGFVVYPPLDAQPQRAVRLGLGETARFEKGELSLCAKVSREPQVITLDWLYVLFAPFVLAGLWKLVQVFGAVFALLLMLLPRPKPPVVAPPAQAVTLRAVKVLKFEAVVPPKPLPERDEDRLKLLMEGKRANEIFAAGAKKNAQRRAAKELRKALEKNQLGLFAMLTAVDSQPLAVLGASKDSDILGALSGSELKDSADFGGLRGGDLGGGTAFGAGGLGVRGTGVGGGGTGLGLGGLGTLGRGSGGGGVVGGGDGRLGGAHSLAVQAARERARSASEDCWRDGDTGQVRVHLEIHRDGTTTPAVLSSSAPERVSACITRHLKSWHLPRDERESKVVLRFVNEE